MEQAKRRETELEQLASEAQLMALRAQINPHFLFNALNSVAALIATDPRRAERCVESLGEVLHRCLQNHHWLSLSEELDFIKSYLEIEQVRFDTRLQVTFEVDSRTLGIQVPGMILQPLVENAIKHGISRKEQGDSILLSCQLKDSTSNQDFLGRSVLEIRISDTGYGMHPDELASVFSGNGVGLGNVRQRLLRHYGPGFAPSIQSELGVGTSVTLRIPGSEN